MSKELKVIMIIGVVFIVGGILLFRNQPQLENPGQPIDSESLVRESSHMTGKKDAKVTVVEFGDYECPACAAAEPTFEQLRQEYKDNPNVNFVFRNFPLPQHQKALVSAEAAEAAGEQGKFWEMHHKLYQNQAKWIGPGDHKALFLQYATELGLDVLKFSQSLEQNKYSDVINTDGSDGQALGVNSTPTFFINGEKTKGYQYDELKSKIEEKLK
jgi:protein-disulfide isomerase